MIDRFEIVDSSSLRPDAERILFCDGTGGRLFQPASDLELSHWRPNQTPAEFRADTSTEICFRFLDHSRSGRWTVAVNNHVDVDGILSVYSLVHSQHALAHRQTIIQAAEMGDFWGWGEPPAQRVFQGITRLIDSGGEGKPVYAEAFRRIPALIAGSDPEISIIDESLAPLRRGVELVEQQRITRALIDNRLVHYIIPLAVAGDDDARASYTPEFNEAITDKMLLWPQARARWDFQRLGLVSTERRDGWFHDLWFPGYLWADTENLWRVPSMDYGNGMQSYEFDHPRLVAAFEALQSREAGVGSWSLGGTQLPLGNELQSRFPLAGRFADDQGRSAVSRAAPHEIAAALAGLFA